MSEPVPPADDPDRTTWVGRARPAQPPPPPVDPWPEEHTLYDDLPPVRPGAAVWPGPAGPSGRQARRVRSYSPDQVRPPRRRRTGGTVLFVLLGLFAMCCAGGIALAYRLNGGFPGSSTVGLAPPPPPGLNTPVADGEFTFVVSAVTCGATSVGRGIITRKASGQYCIVAVTVENTGTKTQNFTDGFQKLVGADGTVYDADITAGVIANESIAGLWSRIAPGSKVSGKIVYDVPVDAKIAKVELHDSPLSGGTTVTL